jgi:HAMP domain-containing protein
MPVSEGAVTEQTHRRSRSHADGASDDTRDRAGQPVRPSTGVTSSRWGWLDFRRWGIRPKLIVVLLIPTIAALVLGGLRMQSALAASVSYSSHLALADAVKQSAATIRALQNERDLTAGYMASNPRPSTGSGAIPSHVDREVAALRTSFASVDFSQDETLESKVDFALDTLAGLPGVRSSAASLTTRPGVVFAKYTVMINRLLAVNYELGEGLPGEDLSEQTDALGSLAAAEEAASVQRATIYSALSADAFTRSEFAELSTAHAAWIANVKQFKSQGSPAQQERFKSTVPGADVDRVNQIVRTALASESPDVLGTLGITADQWFDAASGQMTQLHQVQTGQLDDITREIQDLRDSARTEAVISAVIILAILSFALLATLLVARSILRPLQRLRSAALNVAHTRLPETVRRLQEGDGSDADLTVAPVRVESNDEIGQVARAFDDVHIQAVRLAGEQALMRGSVSGLFLNLSRRSQALVERQLALIDDLERGEKDPDRLASLFKLDHLATRMRRNDENLLVLAGASEGGRRRVHAVSLVDVVRAASAEVEQYARVQIDVPSGCDVSGAAAKDTVHLIAELLENATTFSSPTTTVVARGRSLASNGDFLIEVEDQGIGMTAQEYDSANEKLIAPAIVDVAMSQMMGLFVVARLAQRQGIEVRLRPSNSGGVTALVKLPASIIEYASHEVEVTEPAASALASSPHSSMTRPRPLPDESPESSAAEQSESTGPATKPLAAKPPGRPVVERTPTAPRWAKPKTDQAPPTEPTPAAEPASAAEDTQPAKEPAPTAAPAEPAKEPAPSAAELADATAPTAPPRAQRVAPKAPKSRPARAATNPDRPPIFQQLQSEWFKRPESVERVVTASSATVDAEGDAEIREPAEAVPNEPEAPSSWKSPGDEGWEAAAALDEPSDAGVTDAGLPKRVPGRNLVPGSARGGGNGRSLSQRRPEPARSLTDYQRGVGRARQAGAVAQEAPEQPDNTSSEETT